MTQTILILEANYVFLGEIHLEDGAFRGARLTKRGEAVLGAVLRRWQLHGIPKRHEMVERMTGGESLKDYRIHKSEAGFGEAMLHWAEHHGFHAFRLSETELNCWNKILELPLEEHERYAILQAVCKGTASQVKKIDQFLSNAVKMAEDEAARIEEEMKKKRQNAAAKLVKKHA